MKNLLSILFLFVPLLSESQLYVGNNSYIYNKSSLLFVKGNVELNGTANLYLRNGGQLLQGATGSSTNKGTGKISVFQEGTVNNYSYNYWCSPVGEATTASGNGDFGATMLHVPVTNTSSSPAVMNDTGLDGVSGTGMLSIATYWIWRFLSSANYSGWFFSGSATNISAGQGFTMKGTSGSDLTDVGEFTLNNGGSRQRYDFRGKPNDGTILVDVAENGFTLTGNPYPSALNVNAFLLDPGNSACDGIAYYWEQASVSSHVLMDYQGGYGTYSPISLESGGVYVPAIYNTYNPDGSINTEGASSGLTIERKFAPIGQGFMVKGVSNGVLSLKNQHRYFMMEGDSSQFHRFNNAAISSTQASLIPQIRLNTVMNNQYTSQIALVFVPTATDGLDTGIDAKSPVGNVPNDVYFSLENDKYVIQGVNFDIEKRIPLGIKSTDNCSFRFDASQILNFDASQPIFLYDAEDDSYHDIKNSFYEVSLPTGIYNDRFQITFRDHLLHTNDIQSGIVVFQNNSSQMLMVSNPNRLEIKSVKIYDLSGRQILNRAGLAVEEMYRFPTNGFSDGVYLVQVLSDNNNLKIQKVLISSK